MVNQSFQDNILLSFQGGHYAFNKISYISTSKFFFFFSISLYVWWVEKWLLKDIHVADLSKDVN